MRRLLIVDDEPAIRSLLSKVFARAGYDVKTAPNARQAMALLAAERFDALLSDVDMISIPPMDGHELVRWVATNHSTVRCVLMSALNIGCEECPFAAGCRILAKPFKPADAVAMLEWLLSNLPNGTKC